MTSVRLGLRLALTPAARLRTGLLLVSVALACLVLLVTVAAARHQVVTADSYRTEMPRLMLAVVATIAVPCAVLVTTVARLSASLRDRRLANLRLIGLSPHQTRLVAATETGVAAAVGAILGLLGFWALRPLLLGHGPGGQPWGVSFAPAAVDQVAVVVGVVLLVVLSSVLPTRSRSADALTLARRADRTPPGWWRLAPLALGIGLCVAVLVSSHRSDADATDLQVGGIFAGVALTALGIVLVLPVLVRLLTRFALGRPLGPAPRLAVRRLEAQPAGIARIIGALLIGLFLVTGARFVLVAFESTSQYLAAAQSVEVEQKVALPTTAARVARDSTRLAAVEGVDEILDLPMLENDTIGLSAVVATCAELARAGAHVTGCRDGQAMWLKPDGDTYVRNNAPGGADLTSISWTAGHGPRTAAMTDVDLPGFDAGDDWSASLVYFDAVVPPSMVADLPATTQHTLVVTGPPGRDLPDRLIEDGFDLNTFPSFEEYDFVATLRTVIWTIAGVVLGVGLLALAISSIDRAIQRRKEVVGLQLVGLGPGVIRRAQWLETAVPVLIGSVLAVGLGALAGATYLTIDEAMAMPWGQTWALAAVAALGSVGVAAITVTACAPPLRAAEIRAE